MNIENPSEINHKKETFLNEDDIRIWNYMIVGGDPDEIVVVKGKRFKKIPTNWTEKQYFSHSTEEAGSGPGWDLRFSRFKQKNINILSKDPLEELSDEIMYEVKPIDS